MRTKVTLVKVSNDIPNLSITLDQVIRLTEENKLRTTSASVVQRVSTFNLVCFIKR